MILKKIDQLQGNEVLARALMTWDYQIVLPEGAVLRLEYIDKLRDLGIEEVYIREQEQKAQNIAILKSEIEDSVKEKVKDILERHTYQHNQELAELSNTADNIITNILEEEQIIEQVFDIKERSSDIYEHSISVCSIAILTALKLGVEKSKTHDIGVGCLLHDIGLRYLTVDYENKNIEDRPEKEQVEYKKHPVYGYSTLQNEPWISNCSKNIILTHHERMDGSGFPLKITDIPLESRIVNVCDAFDEMICGIACTRSKVYEAIEYLKTFKNTKFDGKVVDTFLGFTAVYPAGTHVMTNEGEIGVVLHQNKDFQDRPVIRIVRDKNGNPVKGEVLKDLVKVHSVFIEKALD